jgi:hypothetical protein
MAGEVRPIRTKRDHDAALKEVERRWGAKAGTRNGDRLDWIDVDRGHLAAEPHGFKRDCSSAGERVEHLRRAPAVGFADFLPEPVEIRAVLPSPMQGAAARLALVHFDCALANLLSLDLLDDLAGKPAIDRLAFLGIAWIGQQRRDQRRAARGERPPCRPDMQCRDMPVPHILLVHRVKRHLLQREIDLDEPFVVHDFQPRKALLTSPTNRLND